MEWDRLHWLLGLFTAAIAAAWADLGMALQILLILMAIDMVTGIVAAFVARVVDSSVGWRGVGKKILVLAVVAMAAAVEPILGGAPVAVVVTGFYCAIEGISILENVVAAGVKVPDVLMSALVKLREIAAADRQVSE